MSDTDVGISLRLIRDYKPEEDIGFSGGLQMHDLAFMLAMGDERDIPIAQKLADAWAFIKSRIH